MKLQTLFLATTSLALAACHHKAATLPELPVQRISLPSAGDVESVIYLAGDMGNAHWEQNPLLHQMRDDIEKWSAALQRDSAVSVIFLGDNIYPKGMRTEPQFFAEDSARLQAQVNILGGPSARSRKAFGVFIAGNHDWGHMPGAPGEQRLRNQEEFLARRREASVRLQPKAGSPGPGIIDIGRRIRIVLIDTAWWLLSADKNEKAATMARLTQTMVADRGREIVIASHHPYRSASAHGGLVNFWSSIGLEWLLNRSGASLQDLNSLPYRDFLGQIEAAFKTAGVPLVYVGGHDHSLQLMHAVKPLDPRFILVSGAGSKTSPVSVQNGMMYRSPDAGYMQLIVRKNGGVDLFIYGMPFSDSFCTSGDVNACVQKGVDKVEMKYSMTLKP